MSNYFALKSQNIFELYAVICHIGPSSMSGHFVAYCKNSIDKKWYKYNDSLVNECKRKDEFRLGYNTCMSYSKENQELCLINLLNRENQKTLADKKLYKLLQDKMD